MTPATQSALDTTNRLYARLVERRKRIKVQYEYLDGVQPLKFATEEWAEFHKDRFKGFSDNWCDVVANASVDRMRIIGMRLTDETAGSEVVSADERELWSDWQRNELTSQSNQGFLASVVAKRSFTIVWAGDDDETPEVTWERPDQVIVDYVPGGRRGVAALKAWSDSEAGFEYATLYTAEAVWKWQRPLSRVAKIVESTGLEVPLAALPDSGDWAPREKTGDDAWPLDNPLGTLPVVEWANRPRLGGEPISDIDGVMHMQDAINALWGYLFPAADQASMKARVIMGGEPPKVPILNEHGQKIGERPVAMSELGPRRLLYLSKAEKIGEFEASKLDVFTDVIMVAKGHVAAQTRTPGHYLLTNSSFANLNGDALTAAEVPLATKCANQQMHYNPAAKETAALMALVRGKAGLADQIRASDGERFVQWKDPAMHSLAQVADAATKDRAVGMSMHTILERRYGMSEPEIQVELERIRAERRDPTLERIADGILNAGSNLGE